MASSRARAYPDESKDDVSWALLPDGRRAAIQAGLAAPDIAKARKAWDRQAAFLRRFVKVGGRIATGTGFEWRGYPLPGVGIHREMAALVKAGLTPAEALRAATASAGDLLALAGSPKPGRIEVGAGADLILVSGDPLSAVEDAARMTSVVRAGEVLEPAALLERVRRSLAGPIRK
jgi:imidazolonepropionase-like amidohydrolase